jgi:hypothetical protein
VQGLRIAATFPLAYGSNERGILAITCGLHTAPCSNINSPGTIHTGGGGVGGEYTLNGTPTGFSYPVLPELADIVYDGTSNGQSDPGARYYVVEHASGWTYGSVYVYDSNWQNERLLFTQQILEHPTGIAYDPYDGSLWISNAGPTDILAHFSLTGRFLSGFPTRGGGQTALAFDPADGTLWTIDAWHPQRCPSVGLCATLQQWSTNGALLQSGAIDGVPAVFWTSGEMPETATPEPGTLLLVTGGILGIVGAARKRQRCGS